MIDYFQVQLTLFRLQVSARCLAAGVHGAIDNVKINLKDITDTEYVETTMQTVDKLGKEVNENCNQILGILLERQ